MAWNHAWWCIQWGHYQVVFEGIVSYFKMTIKVINIYLILINNVFNIVGWFMEEMGLFIELVEYKNNLQLNTQVLNEVYLEQKLYDVQS